MGVSGKSAMTQALDDATCEATARFLPLYTACLSGKATTHSLLPRCLMNSAATASYATPVQPDTITNVGLTDQRAPTFTVPTAPGRIAADRELQALLRHW